ncbi:MAG: hypothetical protein IT384_27465 [Deltaproteobacteria bacterium]|nr:hypothetical protein [Deltaproteobacteria bacterium]
MAESLTTKILIEIRDSVRATNERLDRTNERADQTNEHLSILAKITQGIHTRLERMERQPSFLPRRVEVLEAKVERIEARLDRGTED